MAMRLLSSISLSFVADGTDTLSFNLYQEAPGALGGRLPSSLTDMLLDLTTGLVAGVSLDVYGNVNVQFTSVPAAGDHTFSAKLVF